MKRDALCSFDCLQEQILIKKKSFLRRWDREHHATTYLYYCFFLFCKICKFLFSIFVVLFSVSSSLRYFCTDTRTMHYILFVILKFKFIFLLQVNHLKSLLRSQSKNTDIILTFFYLYFLKMQPTIIVIYLWRDAEAFPEIGLIFIKSKKVKNNFTDWRSDFKLFKWK